MPLALAGCMQHDMMHGTTQPGRLGCMDRPRPHEPFGIAAPGWCVCMGVFESGTGSATLAAMCVHAVAASGFAVCF